MTKKEFVQAFFLEYQTNGFSEHAMSFIDAGLLQAYPGFLQKLQNIDINSFDVTDFSYEKVTKKSSATEQHEAIPRSVETIVIPHKFKCLINDEKTIVIFCHGDNEENYKLIGQI